MILLASVHIDERSNLYERSFSHRAILSKSGIVCSLYDWPIQHLAFPGPQPWGFFSRLAPNQSYLAHLVAALVQTNS